MWNFEFMHFKNMCVLHVLYIQSVNKPCNSKCMFVQLRTKISRTIETESLEHILAAKLDAHYISVL